MIQIDYSMNASCVGFMGLRHCGAYGVFAMASTQQRGTWPPTRYYQLHHLVASGKAKRVQHTPSLVQRSLAEKYGYELAETVSGDSEPFYSTSNVSQIHAVARLTRSVRRSGTSFGMDGPDSFIICDSHLMADEYFYSGALSPVNLWLGPLGGYHWSAAHYTERTAARPQPNLGVVKSAPWCRYMLAAVDSKGEPFAFMYSRNYESIDRYVSVVSRAVTSFSLPLPEPCYPTDFEFSADGRLLAIAAVDCRKPPDYPTSLYLLDATTFAVLEQYEFPARYVSFSPDGLTLACLGPAETYGPDTTSNILTIIDLE